MKKDVPLCHLFFHDFSLQPFKSAHRKNKFREVLNDEDPVRKISFTEFAVFGPAKPEHSFRKNFRP